MDENRKQQLWQAEATRLGGKDPLLNFKPSSYGQVDLTKAHPGGLAQLVSSRSGRILNLVRDGAAQSRALSATRRVAQRARRLHETLGINTSYIAAGSIVFAGEEEQHLPMLLWPVQLVARADDFEILLAEHCILNPYFESWVMNLGGMEAVNSLRQIAFSSSELLPFSYLERAYQILDKVDVRIERQLHLGNFAPEICYVAAWRQLDPNPLLSQLASDAPSDSNQVSDSDDETPDASVQEFVRQSLAESADLLPRPELLVANADQHQQRVIRLANAGRSFAVETLPGCGYLQLVVNVAANNALLGRRTLVIASRVQTLDELAERFSEVGLPGLGLRMHEPWLDAISAISRSEKARQDAHAEATGQLEHAQRQVESYLAGVRAESADLGVGLVEALRKLAELAAENEPPTNSARIAREHLTGDPDIALALLRDCHEAGLFAVGEQDSPWFDSRFGNQSEIAIAVQIAGQLAEEFSGYRYRLNKYLEEVGLKPSSSVQDWGRQIELLIGVRDTLDRFQPAIYDHALTDMIEATASRASQTDFSGAQRRRFKKLAKEYIRPGSSVPNLHEALLSAEQQRVAWQETTTAEQAPKVPLGLNEVVSEFTALSDRLQILQRHLGLNPDRPLLVELGFDDLDQRLRALATNTSYLEGMIERQALWQNLDTQGLLDLGRQLTELHPSPERVKSEFELSWWQSALEAIISTDSRVLEFDAEAASQVEANYINAQEALVKESRALLASRLAAAWQQSITTHTAEAEQLRAMLKSRTLIAAQAAALAPRPWRALTPVVMGSPFQLQQLEPNDKFDCILLLDAASTGMAEARRAIAMGGQAIAFGDPVIAAAEEFETAVRPFTGDSDRQRYSVYRAFEEAFGSIEINHSYRMGGQVMARYLNQEFYQDRISFLPARREYFGERNFDLVQIRSNNRAATTIDGATESMDAELHKAVELVLSHARWHPEESLLVATASRSHQERIQAQLEQELDRQPQLREFFNAHGREQFEVFSLADMTHRLADRVIFSLGFGRTPDGSISPQLGALSSPLATKRLANLIVSARKRVTVVSCYAAPDFQGLKPGDPLNHLAELHAPQVIDTPLRQAPDSLLRDLALRLQKLGLTARMSYATSVPLAVSFGNKAAVIDPDWTLGDGDIDEQIRLRPGLLRAMGWEFIRVRAFELFANPQAVAESIAKQLGYDPIRVTEPVYDSVGQLTDTWGDYESSNDRRLREERPPHWG